MPRGVDLRLRRGLAAAWTSTNPVLNDGEVGVESDTDAIKVGDGVSVWTALPYSGQVMPGGLLQLTGAASNLIELSAAGLSLPSNGTAPPVGQKITLYKTRSSSDGDYSLGVNNNELWVSTGSGLSRAFVVRINYTNRFAVSNTGATVTGTMSVSGSLIVAANNVAQFNGGSKLGQYAVKSASYTMVQTDKYIEVTAASATITLPSVASAVAGYDYYITNVSGGSITVQGSTSTAVIGNTSSAAQTYPLPAGATLHVVSNGTLWRIL